MELLVLGGTAFPGPEIVASAQRRGWKALEKAIAAGSTFRPLADTVRDTLAWWTKQHSGEYVWGGKAGQPGLSAERELVITTEWETSKK